MKVKFLTLGCKVNQYETQALMEEFIQSGHQIARGIADLYIINTCTVTSRADSKSKEAIAKSKKENPKAKVVACGCLAQLNAEALERLGVDYIVPQDKKANLTDIVLERKASDRGIWSLGVSTFFNQRAFIKIQDGCDNFCSFCKIPHTRGRSKSRAKNEVITEVERVSIKHKELVLCGINLGLYGRDLKEPCSLEELLKQMLAIKTLGRIRLSSLEPNLISDGLINLLADDKLCPHLHLPFQSGDDEILKKMNKKETVVLYEEIVNKARKVDPEVAISCDIMVGFPHESEAAFANTVEFLKKVRPMRMHIFSFSPRDKTPLSKAAVKDHKVTKQRYKILKELHDEFSLEYKNRFLNKTLFMVAEEEANGFICGYTQNYLKVHIVDKVDLGQIIPVKIDKIDSQRVLAKAL